MKKQMSLLTTLFILTLFKSQTLLSRRLKKSPRRLHKHTTVCPSKARKAKRNKLKAKITNIYSNKY